MLIHAMYYYNQLIHNLKEILHYHHLQHVKIIVENKIQKKTVIVAQIVMLIIVSVVLITKIFVTCLLPLKKHVWDIVDIIIIMLNVIALHNVNYIIIVVLIIMINAIILFLQNLVQTNYHVQG
jgi:hypothetical protein